LRPLRIKRETLKTDLYYTKRDATPTLPLLKAKS
jgi:hypothetical protein